MQSNIIIKRKVNGTYNVIDYIFKNGKQFATQTNLTSKNRKGSKEYNLFGKIIAVNSWEYI